MYGAQIWGKAMTTKTRRTLPIAIHRACASRTTCAYRMAPNSALAVISGIQPFDITAQQRHMELQQRVQRQERLKKKNTPWGVHKEKGARKAEKADAERWAREAWTQAWENEEITGQWTKRLISARTPWIERKHGAVDYYLTQALTGHGAFNAYLKRFKKRRSAQCRYCGEANDTAEHTILNCTEWDTIRGPAWTTTDGGRISPEK